MAVRLRLRREGTKKTPHYRVVAADKRAPRNGKFIEIIGEYHPLDDPSTIKIDHERALHWLRHGAQPSSQVEKLLRIVGVWEEFKPGDEPKRDRSADKPKLSKKAKAKKKEEEEAAAAAADEPAAETAEEPAAPADEESAETAEAPAAEASAEDSTEETDDTDAAADADADADAEEDES
jgi:small subunit ribosomal protein S16